ncbi:hypothetical protein ACLOJK_009213 [Asimina triloba]
MTRPTNNDADSNSGSSVTSGSIFLSKNGYRPSETAPTIESGLAGGTQVASIAADNSKLEQQLTATTLVGDEEDRSAPLASNPQSATTRATKTGRSQGSGVNS